MSAERRELLFKKIYKNLPGFNSNVVITLQDLERARTCAKNLSEMIESNELEQPLVSESRQYLLLLQKKYYPLLGVYKDPFSLSNSPETIILLFGIIVSFLATHDASFQSNVEFIGIFFLNLSMFTMAANQLSRATRVAWSQTQIFKDGFAAGASELAKACKHHFADFGGTLFRLPKAPRIVINFEPLLDVNIENLPAMKLLDLYIEIYSRHLLQLPTETLKYND